MCCEFVANNIATQFTFVTKTLNYRHIMCPWSLYFSHRKTYSYMYYLLFVSLLVLLIVSFPFAVGQTLNLLCYKNSELQTYHVPTITVLWSSNYTLIHSHLYQHIRPRIHCVYCFSVGDTPQWIVASTNLNDITYIVALTLFVVYFAFLKALESSSAVTLSNYIIAHNNIIVLLAHAWGLHIRVHLRVNRWFHQYMYVLASPLCPILLVSLAFPISTCSFVSCFH